MKTIIVDDELQSHQILKDLLAQHHPELNVIGSGDSVKKGYDLIKKFHPELIFLDIEMPDGSGFDLLDKIENCDFNVIFITAHNEYAITAIKFGALDYLMKPIGQQELAESVKRALDKQQEKISNDQLQIIMETLQNIKIKKLPTRIAISTTEGIHYKLVKNIMRLEAQQNYTEFSLEGEPKKLLASQNLGEFVDQFEMYRNFMKVHRSHLVNLYYVGTYVRADGGYLVMHDGAQVSVSKVYRDELLERLAKL